MNKYFGCDAHKRYSVFVSMNDRGQSGLPVHVENNRELFREFLRELPPGSPIAIESVGNWYWMIEEMERAGHGPLLVHAAKLLGLLRSGLQIPIAGPFQVIPKLMHSVLRLSYFQF